MLGGANFSPAAVCRFTPSGDRESGESGGSTWNYGGGEISDRLYTNFTRLNATHGRYLFVFTGLARIVRLGVAF